MLTAAFLCALLSCTYGSDRAPERAPNPSCLQPSIMNRRIIDANASRAAGAVFIINVRPAPPLTCADACCAEPGCNLAVYRPDNEGGVSPSEKGRGSPCYLFNCQSPSVCTLAEHSHYSVAIVDRTHPPAVVTAAPASSSKAVAFLGSCQLGDQCEGINTECSAGMCMCKENHHRKNDVCRERCDPVTSYECVNGGIEYSGPDCIAVYDVCNGIPECADGSDEVDCAAATLPGAGGAHSHGVSTQVPSPAAAVQKPDAPSAVAMRPPAAVQPPSVAVVAIKDQQQLQLGPTSAATDPPQASTHHGGSGSRDDDVPVAAGAGSMRTVPAAGQLDTSWAAAQRSSAVAALVLGTLLAVALAAYGVRRCIVGASPGNLVHRVKAMGWGSKPDADYLINGMYL